MSMILLKTMEKLNEKTFYTLSRRGVWVEYDKWEYTTYNGKLKSFYEVLIRRYKLSDRVKIYEWTSNISEFMNKSCIF